MIDNDLGKGLLYDTDMKVISKYKLDELRIIAGEYNILLKENGKNKTKKELYELIYRKKIE